MTQTILATKPTTIAPAPQPQSWFTKIRQNFGAFWNSPKQYLQYTLSRYRNILLGAGIIAGGASVAWWLSKSKQQLTPSLPTPSKMPTVPRASAQFTQ